jgi:hypothetical protein
VLLAALVGGGSTEPSVLVGSKFLRVAVDDPVGVDVWEVLVLRVLALETLLLVDVAVGQDPDIMSTARWRKEEEQELWMHDLAVEENPLQLQPP